MPGNLGTARIHPPETPEPALGMTAMGHEDPFPPPRLSARYVIRQETFAGTHGNGRDAPIAAVPRSRVKPRWWSFAARVLTQQAT
jgi:hypothetical protein